LLALWEAALIYVEEGQNHEHQFSVVAYYNISNALRNYRNTFFNVVTIPQKEATSKRAYMDLINLLEFSSEIFNNNLDSEEIALEWEHESELTLSTELRKGIRTLKRKISPTKTNYNKAVRRSVSSGPPVSAKKGIEGLPDSSGFMLDFKNYREGLNLFDRAVFELKVSGMSNKEASEVIKQSPRRIKDSWTKLRKDVIQMK
jgi:hypothetical protein